MCDSWGIDEATVVCRQLHFAGASSALTNNEFGPGMVSNWHIGCDGNEKTLSECYLSQYRSCRHYENAGVICTGMYTHT